MITVQARSLADAFCQFRTAAAGLSPYLAMTASKVKVHGSAKPGLIC